MTLSNNKKKIILISFFTLILIAIFLFYGLNSKNFSYFLSMRSKKIVAILISSYCIAYSSVIFQTITNNRILTPSVIGLDSLYLFIQTFIIYFFGTRELALFHGNLNYFLSIIVMIIFSILLFLLLFKNEEKSIYFLILSGMIFGTLFNGLSTFMQVLLDPNEFNILQGKIFASFNNINQNLLLVSLIIVIIIIIFSLKDNNILDALSLGRDIAINLGVDYKKTVFKMFLITSVLISVSTALIGPISFLGILVVNLSREIFKSYKHSLKITGAILISILSLIIGQFIVEKIFKFEATVSVIINFIGGVYFLYIILKESKF